MASVFLLTSASLFLALLALAALGIGTDMDGRGDCDGCDGGSGARAESGLDLRASVNGVRIFSSASSIRSASFFGAGGKGSWACVSKSDFFDDYTHSSLAPLQET